MPPKMTDADRLEPGDVLLSVGHFDGASHKFINGGQLTTLSIRNTFRILTGRSPIMRDISLCHAMIYVGNFQVAEAVGRGITMNDIEFPHEYKVWRYKQAGVAVDAAGTGVPPTSRLTLDGVIVEPVTR